MGYGSWSDHDYSSRAKERASVGKSAFGYTDEEMSKVRPEKRKVNQQMDPRGVTRESRDSATHPESLAIAVIFDHTGSMGGIPRILQRRLAELMGSLMEKDGIKHPQILFGAVGDATSDQAPLQIGQFESDISMEDSLGHLLLEGQGGPYGQESYELALYFMAKHTAIDCFEKRKKKGYLFLIGDECPYDVKANEIKTIIGDDLVGNISIQQIIAEAREKYNVFFIVPTGASGGRNPEVMRRWVELLGQEFLVQLDDSETISKRISLIVRTAEGKITSKTTKTKKPDEHSGEAPKKTRRGRL